MTARFQRIAPRPLQECIGYPIGSTETTRGDVADACVADRLFREWERRPASRWHSSDGSAGRLAEMAADIGAGALGKASEVGTQVEISNIRRTRRRGAGAGTSPSIGRAADRIARRSSRNHVAQLRLRLVAATDDSRDRDWRNHPGNRDSRHIFSGNAACPAGLVFSAPLTSR